MLFIFIEIGIIAVDIVHNALSVFHGNLTSHSCLIFIIDGHLIAFVRCVLLLCLIRRTKWRRVNFSGINLRF